MLERLRETTPLIQCIEAVRAARESSTPWTLDPVAVGIFILDQNKEAA
jgi:hydroxyethylthiazole kinase-like sugar kinase family protein